MKHLILIGMLLSFTTACSTLSGWFTNETEQSVTTELTVDLDATHEKLSDAGSNVVKSTNKIEQATNALTVKNIEPTKKVIKKETTKLRAVSVKLADVASDIKVAAKEVPPIIANAKLTETKIKELEKQLSDYENGVKKRQQWIWTSIMSLCGIGFVIGVFMAVSGNVKFGSTLACTALFITSVAYFMAQYAIYVAMAGGVIFFCFFSVIIWYFYKNRKALVESITTTEVLRKDNRHGWDKAKDTINQIQSVETKKLIRHIKDSVVNR